MKGDFAGLFGIEKDQGFKSALGTIYQTFDGKELTPAPKRRPPTCFTLSSRTTLSATAINESPRPFLSTF
jgi:hypothetical protein